jgi:hypothetical protein
MMAEHYVCEGDDGIHACGGGSVGGDCDWGYGENSDKL